MIYMCVYIYVYTHTHRIIVLLLVLCCYHTVSHIVLNKIDCVCVRKDAEMFGSEIERVNGSQKNSLIR